MTLQIGMHSGLNVANGGDRGQHSSAGARQIVERELAPLARPPRARARYSAHARRRRGAGRRLCPPPRPRASTGNCTDSARHRATARPARRCRADGREQAARRRRHGQCRRVAGRDGAAAQRDAAGVGQQRQRIARARLDAQRARPRRQPEHQQRVRPVARDQLGQVAVDRRIAGRENMRDDFRIAPKPAAAIAPAACTSGPVGLNGAPGNGPKPVTRMVSAITPRAIARSLPRPASAPACRRRPRPPPGAPCRARPDRCAAAR